MGVLVAVWVAVLTAVRTREEDCDRARPLRASGAMEVDDVLAICGRSMAPIMVWLAGEAGRETLSKFPCAS